jgi:hypothetical protein
MSKYAQADLAGIEHAELNPITTGPVIPPFDWTFFLLATGVGAYIGHELCKVVSPQSTRKQKLVCTGAGAGAGAFVSIFLTVKERQDALIYALLDTDDVPDTDTGL